jgi:two-component system, LytTR family, sensor kinase
LVLNADVYPQKAMNMNYAVPSPQPWSVRLRSLLWDHVLGWLAVLVLTILFFGFLLPWPQAIQHTVIQLMLMMGVFYVNAHWLMPRFAARKQWRSYWLLMGLVFVVATGLRVLFISSVDIAPALLVLRSPNRQVLFPIGNTLIILFVSTVYQLLRNHDERAKQQLAIINEQKEAQLQLLRAQINPHFLFNTLNNIYALAVAKSDAAPTMILRLSDLLRYVIYDGQRERVSLSREADQCQRFIDLFQMRYPTPRSLTFTVEGDPDGQLFEPMILIPLVENCFKHGDFDHNESAFADFNLSVGQSVVRFTAVNSFDPDNRQKDQVGGVGLANIRRRLELSYPGAYQLDCQAQNRTFTVSLRVSL